MTRAKRIKKPKHRTELRAHAIAMDLSHTESDQLFAVLHTCHGVRNLLVKERADNRAAVREGREAAYITKADQYKRLSALSKSDPRIGAVYSQVLQNIADRIDEGTKRWFDAMKQGRHHAQPPHAIDAKRYKSFTYTQYGSSARIRNGCIELSKLGSFKLFDHRKIRGKKKTVTIKFKDGRWWAVVTVEIQAIDVHGAPDAHEAKPDVGIDPGLKATLTDSAGFSYATPKPLKQSLGELKRAQRVMSRKFEARKRDHAKLMRQLKAEGLETVPLKEAPISNRLRAQIWRVAKCHTKVVRVRDHHIKKNASVVSDRYLRVAVEEHAVLFMLRNRKTARAAADVSIAKQKFALRSKLGDRYVQVANTRPGIGGNSQTCLCGARVEKTLSDRYHDCPECGVAGDRDWVSANIVQHTAFGTTNESMKRAFGQKVLDRAQALLERRGGSKAMRRETSLGGSGISPALELPVKRQPLASGEVVANTAGGEPTAEGKTTAYRKGRKSSALPVAPQPYLKTISAYGGDFRKHPPSGG